MDNFSLTLLFIVIDACSCLLSITTVTHLHMSKFIPLNCYHLLVAKVTFHSHAPSTRSKSYSMTTRISLGIFHDTLYNNYFNFKVHNNTYRSMNTMKMYPKINKSFVAVIVLEFIWYLQFFLRLYVLLYYPFIPALHNGDKKYILNTFDINNSNFYSYELHISSTLVCDVLRVSYSNLLQKLYRLLQYLKNFYTISPSNVYILIVILMLNIQIILTTLAMDVLSIFKLFTSTLNFNRHLHCYNFCNEIHNVRTLLVDFNFSSEG